MALGLPSLRGYKRRLGRKNFRELECSRGVVTDRSGDHGDGGLRVAGFRKPGKLVAAVLLASSICALADMPASAQSLTDRFKSLFGGKSNEPAEGTTIVSPEPETDLTCPPVSIRAGASTYAVAAPGKQPIGNDVRFQATITRTARQCTKVGDQITARIGIQGRVIAGPAGAPSSVDIPLRVAVVQGGVQEKTIATKAYQTVVPMAEHGNEPFSLIAEDLVYPVPQGAAGDSYIFYIGFDPQALKPQAKPKPVAGRKTQQPLRQN
jgi:hypothetical protein